MSVNVKPGDQCRALCETCKQQVEAVYQLRDLPISDGGGVAEGVLCVVCNECGAVCGFHNSSLEAVQAAVKRAVKQNPDLPPEFVEGVVQGEMEIDAGLVEECKPEGCEQTPNPETRAALAESEGIDHLERSSIKDLFK